LPACLASLSWSRTQAPHPCVPLTHTSEGPGPTTTTHLQWESLGRLRAWTARRGGPCLHEALSQDRKRDEDPYTPYASLETDPRSEKKEATRWNGEVPMTEGLCCHVGLHFQAWSLPPPHPHSHPWEDVPTLPLNVPATYAALGSLQVTS
ncbi:hypothetical protein MC885_010867, partial [Smutsia gigantea]